jgi:hypothetical protein
VDREDSGDEKEEEEEEEKKEDNTLAVNPSISSGKTIPEMFATVSAVIGQITRDNYKALISIINADKMR